jgi:hypothetical protein
MEAPSANVYYLTKAEIALIDDKSMFEVSEELGGQRVIPRRQVAIGPLQLCIYIVVNLRSVYCTGL